MGEDIKKRDMWHSVCTFQSFPCYHHDYDTNDEVSGG